MRVLITGAAGRLASEIAEELCRSHELRFVDRLPTPRKNSAIADLAVTFPFRSRWLPVRSKSWKDLFADCDVVLHLAAHAEVSATWESIVRNNIQTAWNVFDAAAEQRVSRVVFASSNWAVRASENEFAGACFPPVGPKLDSQVPARPLTAYGLSKAFGEQLGRMFVEEGRLQSVVSVRIGHYEPTPPSPETLRVRWIGSRDLRSLFKRCVEASFDGYHVVYGVSAQATSPFSLSFTRRLLDWSPQQSSDDPFVKKT